MNKPHTKHELLIYEVGWERRHIDMEAVEYGHDHIRRYYGFVRAKLNSYDSHSKEVMRSIQMESERIGSTPDECMRKAVESFMNGNLYEISAEYHLYSGPCKMDDNWQEWDISIELEEPWKSMFLELFNTKSNLLIKTLKGHEENQNQ